MERDKKIAAEDGWRVTHGPDGSEMKIRASTGSYGGNGGGINTNVWKSEEEYRKNIEEQPIEELK